MAVTHLQYTTLHRPLLRGFIKKPMDIVLAAKLILLGYHEGLYPRSTVKARHIYRYFDSVDLGTLGSIGRGLSALAQIGLLVKVSRAKHTGAKYQFNCPRRCNECNKYGTLECPIVKLKVLLEILEGGKEMQGS